MRVPYIWFGVAPISMAGATAARGGPALALFGIAVVRTDGSLASRWRCLARAGRLDDAQAILDELKDRAKRTYVDGSIFVMLPAALGQMDEALAQLESVIASGYPGTPLNLARPELDSIRSDPRFARLVAGWLGDSPVVATLTRRASART